MWRRCIIPFPSEAIESTLISAQIDNLFIIKELPAQAPTTETSKQVVTLPNFNHKNIKATWIALLVCLYWLPWFSPRCLHLLWSRIWLLGFYCRSCFGNKSPKFIFHIIYSHISTSNRTYLKNFRNFQNVCFKDKIKTHRKMYSFTGILQSNWSEQFY